MTEAEWLACTDPWPMLAHLDGKVDARRVRLMRVAAARSAWPEFSDERHRAAVEVGERYADGLSTDAERDAHMHELYGMFGQGGEFSRLDTPSFELRCLALACVNTPRVARLNDGASWSIGVKHTSDRLPSIIRDIFGNPFRPPVEFPRGWRTDKAMSLARQMYESRDFSAMLILADALHDSGCDNANILDHCRGPGPHVRGCWVIDSILGKE